MITPDFDKSKASRLIVLFSDLDNTSQEGYAVQEVTISAIKQYDEALGEAHAFIQDVYNRPYGAVHGLMVFAGPRQVDKVDLPVPPPLPPKDENMRRFAVAWEDVTQFHGDAGPPVSFFDVGSPYVDTLSARKAAVEFVQALSGMGNRRVLSVEGYDGKKWHDLGTDAMLAVAAPSIAARPR